MIRAAVFLRQPGARHGHPRRPRGPRRARSPNAAGIDLAEKGIEIHNARLSQRNAVYAQFLYERLQRRAILFRDCQRLINQDRNHFAAAMVGAGRRGRDGDRRDAQFLDRAGGGAARHRSDKPGHRVIGVSLVLARGRPVIVADTAITEMPNAEELAHIAIEAAGVARRLGYEPRVALLAFSTFGHPPASAPRGCRRRCASSTTSASISNMTARWPPTSRSTRRRWRSIRSAG